MMACGCVEKLGNVTCFYEFIFAICGYRDGLRFEIP